MVPRQLQLVADVAADGDSRDGGNPKGLDHLVAEENPKPGPRDERPGKALGRSLFGENERPQPLLVAVECVPRPALRCGQFAGQNVGGRHRQRRALAGEKRHAKGRVAHECYTPTRPGSHADLTDAIEIKVIAGIESPKDSRQLPAVTLEYLAQDRLLRRDSVRLRLASACEYEQKQRSVVVEGKTTDLPAGSAMDEVNELVARPISGGFECRDAIAEVLLVRSCGPKTSLRTRE
jgi:hypothetical protein